jgi:cyanate lyase
MDKPTMTDTLLTAKKKEGFTWADLAKQVGLSEMGVASCCYGENSMTA